MWGRLVERFDMRTVLRVAMLGWAVAVIFFGLFLQDFGVAVVMRGVQGLFASGFAALPFIGFTKATADQQERTRYYGHLETAISVGAIASPVLVGAVFAFYPTITMAAIGASVLLVTPFLGKVDLRWGTAEKRQATGIPRTKKRVKARVLVPTVYASAIALVLGAFEALIPTVGQGYSNSVLVGKLMTTAFEITVVAGILLKTRRTGINPILPLLLTTGLIICYAAVLFTLTVIILLIVLGLLIGLQITMGNEYASHTVQGFEETGMGLYSTLRGSGSFLGPLFMNFGFPLVLVMLAVVSLIALGFAGVHRRVLPKGSSPD
jgi:MFS family permease